MPRRRACSARAVRSAIALSALACGFVLAAARAEPACVEIRAARAETLLGRWPAASGDPIRIAYVHSVTLTPVEERYRIERSSLRQTEIRFVEHGPGLPTEADAGPGASWSRRDGAFVVQLDRTFDTITARVDSDQLPRLFVAGRSIDLASWGRRSIELAVRSGSCEADATHQPGA